MKKDSVMADGRAGKEAAAVEQRIALSGASTTFSIQSLESFDVSRPKEWTKWKLRFGRFRLANNLHASSEDIEMNTLIYCTGVEADDPCVG